MKYALSIAGLLFAASACAETGTARITATAKDSKISGIVTFEDVLDGVRVTARLTGVPPGRHGFHVHEFGSCADAGEAAGDHYNPLGSRHGEVFREGIEKAHAGDMGNITAGKDGTAVLEVKIPGVSLTGGKFAFAGRALVLHQKADDFGQPAGNAGARVGCGVIVLADPKKD